MKTPSRFVCFLFFSATWVVACSSNWQNPNGGAGSSAQTDDDSVDTGTSTGVAGSDTQNNTQEPFIKSVSAPTRTEVKVVFGGVGGDEAKGNVESYAIRCEGEALAAQQVVYDSDAGEAVVKTEKQSLGLSCELIVDLGPDGRERLTASFDSADTANFWVIDFADPTGMTQYEIAARRVFMGNRCVVYLEEGEANVFDQEMVDYFDEEVYPIETAFFTAPKDFDGNGRVVLLGLDGGDYYGGYFSPTNALSDKLSMTWGQHSNEMELLHINTRTLARDGSMFRTVVPHEMQHLLYNAHHGLLEDYWPYHDEGLAEVATHLVNGKNIYAIQYYFEDYQGLIRDGLSLVNWTYSQYENYTLAYFFWMYVASRLGGLERLTEVFELPTGSPVEVDDLLRGQLGAGFNELHFESLAALWAQAPEGKWGYEGMIDFPDRRPPHVSVGTSSVNLEPFAGAFFSLNQGEVDYPGTQGESIVYAGIDETGSVDLEPPFRILGGALLTYNGNFEFIDYQGEHSGPDIAQLPVAASPLPRVGERRELISPAWKNPPPVCPQNADLIRQWNEVRMMREMLRE